MGDFDGLTHLATLGLHTNALTALPGAMFRDLTNLQALDLHTNALTALPEDVFRDLTNLQTLDLRANALTALPEGVFFGLTNLQTLLLGSNALTALPEDVFRGLTNLQTLDLKINALTALPGDVFRGLTNLQTLDLSYNFLTALPGALLDDLQARVDLEVDLQGNPGFDLGAPKWEPVSITGDSSNRIDLVIVSEGYTASEMGKFTQDVNAVHAGLFSEDPFLEYARYFNVWKVEVSSNESGADHPEQTPPLMRDTAFDASFSARTGLLAYINERKVFRAIGGLPPVARDSVVVLVNDPQPGGGAGRIAMAATGGHEDSFVDVVLHELGHALAHLADEYVAPFLVTPAQCNTRLANLGCFFREVLLRAEDFRPKAA